MATITYLFWDLSKTMLVNGSIDIHDIMSIHMEKNRAARPTEINKV